mmetsp:Transcript_36470/g.95230  ORF Transcript_36470/g.95230 Transcript_36470/m.95230 type:complete len:266 (+) Transcript_36470:661-1458(+)
MLRYLIVYVCVFPCILIACFRNSKSYFPRGATTGTSATRTSASPVAVRPARSWSSSLRPSAAISAPGVGGTKKRISWSTSASPPIPVSSSCSSRETSPLPGLCTWLKSPMGISMLSLPLAITRSAWFPSSSHSPQDQPSVETGVSAKATPKFRERCAFRLARLLSGKPEKRSMPTSSLKHSLSMHLLPQPCRHSAETKSAPDFWTSPPAPPPGLQPSSFSLSRNVPRPARPKCAIPAYWCGGSAIAALLTARGSAPGPGARARAA